MNRFLSCLLVMTFSALAACSGMRVTTMYDPKGSFATYKTYAWSQESATGVKTEGIVDPKSAELIKTEVEGRLAEEGFAAAAAPASADLIVSCDIWTEQRTARVPNPPPPGSYGPTSPRYGETNWLYDYKAGTLVVELDDPKLKKNVWRGIADAEVKPSAAEKQIKEAVRKIFEMYPPKE